MGVFPLNYSITEIGKINYYEHEINTMKHKAYEKKVNERISKILIFN